ncbi:hypothetical protein DENSPDRAFT_785204 [Dentipellis sp. KUC8613]|nr:hypothetical protein DENSPDRAFT_785204 [Dentipellis sp. KUC8613]
MEKEKPPKYAIANDLWIGRVPWELATLTFPEQLLIALLYPRVYVFKLFPKRVNGHRGDASTLQRGMRGNVSTYAMNIDDIATMVEGNLMPRPAHILASVISITFVGLGKLPPSWMKRVFRVRRQAVSAALRWLKEHNTKYYGNIEISEERLSVLPEDDVPEEITDAVHQLDDLRVLDGEVTGYVPRDDEEPSVGEGAFCRTSSL